MKTQNTLSTLVAELQNSTENAQPVLDKYHYQLTTFSVTKLVYEVLQGISDSYLNLQVRCATAVVTRSDQHLLGAALSHTFSELMSNARSTSHHLMAYVDIEKIGGLARISIICPNTDLASMSLRAGMTKFNNSDKGASSFQLVVAQMFLEKIKGSFHIYQEAAGGSRIVLEVPKVRGEAS